MDDMFGEKDMEDLQKIYDNIVDSIEVLPEDIMKSPNFLMLFIQALMNALTLSTHGAGMSEEVLVNSVKEIWKIKFGKNEVLN